MSSVGDGLRAWKSDASGRTYYLYDGSDPVCELDASGNLQAVNTFGAQGLVSRHTVATNASVFYAFDERGNVAQRLDAGGNALSADLYDAFGARTGTAPPGTGSSGDPWGFGAQWGYQTDNETGLVLCTNRYYDPQQGRFLTRDPMGYDGGVNLYSYVENDPLYWIDPWGLKPGDRYPTRDAAGKQAIRDINPISIRRDQEYVGYLYTNPNGSYSYTAPKPLGQAGGLVRRPQGKPLVGIYHTHGGNDPGFDNEHYSDTDKFTAENLGGANYLGTPSGHLFKYQPVSGVPLGGTVTCLGKGAK